MQYKGMPLLYTHYAAWNLDLDDGYHRVRIAAQRAVRYTLTIDLDGKIIKEKKSNWAFGLNGEYRFELTGRQIVVQVRWHLVRTLGRYSLRLLLDGRRMPVAESDAPKWALRLIGD